jgi:hypothetical protein
MNRSTVLSALALSPIAGLVSLEKATAAECTMAGFQPDAIFSATIPKVSDADLKALSKSIKDLVTVPSGTACPSGPIGTQDQLVAMGTYFKDVGIAYTWPLAAAILPTIALATGVATAFVILPETAVNPLVNSVKGITLGAAAMAYLPRLHDAAAVIAKAMGGAQPLGYYLAVVQRNKNAGLAGWQIPDPNQPYGTPSCNS